MTQEKCNIIKKQETQRTHTLEEIDLNITKLTNIMNDKKLKRTELTKEINEVKKQIQYWLDLDKSQIKMDFENL